MPKYKVSISLGLLIFLQLLSESCCLQFHDEIGGSPPFENGAKVVSQLSRGKMQMVSSSDSVLTAVAFFSYSAQNTRCKHTSCWITAKTSALYKDLLFQAAGLASCPRSPTRHCVFCVYVAQPGCKYNYISVINSLRSCPVWSSVTDVKVNRIRSRVLTLSYLLHSLLGLNDDVTVNSLLATNHSSVTKPRAPRLRCAGRNVSDVAAVQLMNTTGLQSALADNTSDCRLVLFYTRWCRFSMSLAPAYNALARAWPHLPLITIDIGNDSSMNTRYGAVAVPHLLVLHHTKPVSRYSRASYDPSSISDWIANITGLDAHLNASVEEGDYDGPVPSDIEVTTDWWLAASLVSMLVIGSHQLAVKKIDSYRAMFIR